MSESGPEEQSRPAGWREAVVAEVGQVLARLKLDQPPFLLLIKIEEVVEQVLAEQAGGEKSEAGSLAYRFIGRRIYESCQSQEERRRETAYQWLGQYLFRGILPKLRNQRDLAEELTNDSLEIIFKKLDTVRQPEFFLTWASQIAIREVLQYVRKRNISGPSVDKTLKQVKQQVEFEPEEKLAEAEPLETARILDPEELVLNRETLRLIVARIESFKPTKRSRLYKGVLYGTYFLGLDDKELASRFKVSPAEIQKLRFQALKVLRSDRHWLDEIR